MLTTSETPIVRKLNKCSQLNINSPCISNNNLMVLSLAMTSKLATHNLTAIPVIECHAYYNVDTNIYRWDLVPSRKYRAKFRLGSTFVPILVDNCKLKVCI